MSKKVRIIILIVAAILVLCLGFFIMQKKVWQGHNDMKMHMAVNLNAKCVCINFDAYVKWLYEKSGEPQGENEEIDYGRFFADGIYCGRINAVEDNDWQKLKDKLSYDGSPDDICAALEYLMGSSSDQYFCMIISNGKLIQTYYSQTDYAVKNARRLAAEAEMYERGENLLMNDSRKEFLGGYPSLVYRYESQEDCHTLTRNESELPVFICGSYDIMG